MLNGVQGTNNYQVAFQGIGAKTIQQFIPEIGDEAAAHLSKYFDADKVKFNILDNKDNSEKNDENVEILRTDKGISIKSEMLLNLKLEEGDIVRIIKETENSYRCEVIRKESAEHNIWICYCINSIRGQKRRFGII